MKHPTFFSCGCEIEVRLTQYLTMGLGLTSVERISLAYNAYALGVHGPKSTYPVK